MSCETVVILFEIQLHLFFVLIQLKPSNDK